MTTVRIMLWVQNDNSNSPTARHTFELQVATPEHLEPQITQILNELRERIYEELKLPTGSAE